jgi:hypothetical protein
MILISGPLIAKLCLHSRKWAHARLRLGSFGEIVEHQGVLFAPVVGVEAYAGTKFTQEQLAAAAGGKADRILTIAEPQEAA